MYGWIAIFCFFSFFCLYRGRIRACAVTWLDRGVSFFFNHTWMDTRNLSAIVIWIAYAWLAILRRRCRKEEGSWEGRGVA